MADEFYIEGKDQKTAARLLFLAGEHDLDPHVVRSGDDGFYVPEAVYEAFQADTGDEGDEGEDDKPKTTRRRRGTKKAEDSEADTEKEA